MERTNKHEELAKKLLIEITKKEPVGEYRFHPTRKWRFDWAFPKQKIAIEVEGGTWTGGRHIHPVGFERDCEKYNCATAMGWKVFRIPPKMLTIEYLASLLIV